MLAHFVLTNYVVCKELRDTIFSQIVWTLMGMSFSVVYTIISFILLELLSWTSDFVSMYKLFIDYLFLIWTGPTVIL